MKLLIAAFLSLTLVNSSYAEETQPKNKSVLVVMKEQADLSLAEDLQVLSEKRAYVYDTLRKLALRTQEDLVEQLTAKGVLFSRLYILNAISVYNPSKQLLAELQARDDVEKIIPGPNIRLPKPVAEFDMEALMEVLSDKEPGDNLQYVGATNVWEDFGATGEGIVIGGQDTGIQWDHPALVRQYRGTTVTGLDHNYNWHDAIKLQVASRRNKCGYATKEPCDDNDHGTHTLGTVLGAEEDKNFIGMAPNSQWIGCRNMDGGVGRPQFYMECFEFFLAPYAQGANPMTDGDPFRSADVINNSWGCPVRGSSAEGCQSDEFRPVLAAMKAAGIMVVVSAGNEGSSCGSIGAQPATVSDLVFTVGAYSHRSKKIASFSSRGPSILDGAVGPDVVAPGVSIRSATTGSGYSGWMWSGTSMAGPHVAGLVALMWSANPELKGNVDATAKIIRQTAIPKTTNQTCGGVPGSEIPNNTYGHGVIDAYAAVQAAINF